MTEPWWKSAVIYQIYVRSFCDSNGDGIGDLPGVTSRLRHVADLGCGAIWLTPFYRSPQADHGYDVADYRDVDPLFGTLADFDELVATAHGLGLKVLVDVVPNHTSSEHPWFQEALASPAGSPARQRYHFRPPGASGAPPNNWRSVFGGSAWSPGTEGEHYLHLFAPEQPDLNWRNDEVHDEMDSVLRFWLDRGADGFRIDVAHGLYKHHDLADTPDPTAKAGTKATEHLQSISANHIWDQPEVHGVYRRWRSILDGYEGDRMMVGEVFLFDPDAIARYVGDDRLHQAFNFTLMGSEFDAGAWRHVIALSLERLRPCAWVLSNHDVARHATRYGGGEAGRRRARAATLAMLALPGAAYLFQGEELGLEDAVVPEHLRQDPIWTHTSGKIAGRDGCRAPIPWEPDPPAHGFTTGEAWLPFPPDAAERAVEVESKDGTSTLALYQAALDRRQQVTGELEWLDSPAGSSLAFRRGALTVVVNFAASPLAWPVSDGAEIALTSADVEPPTAGSLTVPGETTVWLW
jgi:alpha-glucosidase